MTLMTSEARAAMNTEQNILKTIQENSDPALRARIAELEAQLAELKADSGVTDAQYAWGLLLRTAEGVCQKLESETASVTILDQSALREAITLASRASPLQRQAEPSVVKPLEWGVPYTDKSGYVSYDARSILGGYSVYCRKPGMAWIAERSGMGRRIGAFDTEAEAKDAVQSDYDACIRSTLIGSKS